jgi:hypothetical protein
VDTLRAVALCTLVHVLTFLRGSSTLMLELSGSSETTTQFFETTDIQEENLHSHHRENSISNLLACLFCEMAKVESSLSWDNTRRRLVVGPRRFGKTYLYHLQGSTTNPRRVTSHKSEGLNYSVAEA